MFYNSLKNKKIIIFLLFIFLFLGFSSFVFATVVEAPLPGWDPEAVERKNLLPEYIRWLFEFSITIAGLIAFGALIYAGFSYLTSAGDPTKINDAKDRISAALLGLAILLGSHLILTTIDPHLVVLRPAKLEPVPVVELPPPPQFDFAFTIEPTTATIDSEYTWWHDWPGSNTARIILRTSLKTGESKSVVFAVAKPLPPNISYMFPQGTRCTPTCTRELVLISNGANEGTHTITINALYVIDPQIEGPLLSKTQPFELTIKNQ